MANPTISPMMLRRLRRLSLRQLIYFLELERHGGFGRAAKALAISQPTLSQQIMQLETEIGVKLIERSTRRFVLTPEGALLSKRLRRAMAYLSEAISSVEGDRRQNSLSIGIPHHTAYPIVTETLRRFVIRSRGVMPQLLEIAAEEMSQMLSDGEIDAGFMSLPTPARLSRDVAFMPVWQTPLLFCLPRTHPFASLDVLLAEHIAQLDIVLVPRDYHRTLYDYQLACLRKFGIEPRLIKTDVTSIQSHMALTSAGMGSCLLPDITPLPSDLVLRPSLPELGTHELALFWRRDCDMGQIEALRSAARASAM